MILLTYNFKLKCSKSTRNILKQLKYNSNCVWNYINQIHRLNYQNYKRGSNPKFLSAFDINNLLSGTSKELNLHSQTIQAISELYVSNKKTSKKSYLRFRSTKRQLGWIPLKTSGFKIIEDKVIYQKKTFKFWKSRELPSDAVIKTGSFVENSKGDWYFNVTFSTNIKQQHVFQKAEVGIDLGIKEALTLSDSQIISRPDLTKKYEKKLAVAQRAGKKKRVTAIHHKIKNSRKDYYHKITSLLTRTYLHIIIGNVKSQDIIDNNIKNITKGVYDASWAFIKDLLEYKAIKLGGSYTEVSEEYTTQDCSSCGARCGPKGKEGLSVRFWECELCHAKHDRDINSAKNILQRVVRSCDEQHPGRKISAITGIPAL